MAKLNKDKIIPALIFIIIMAGFTTFDLIRDNIKNEKSTRETTLLNENQFKQMLSSPNKFKGYLVEFYGKVFVTPRKDGKMTYIQAYVDPENSSKNVMIQFEDTSIDIKNNDTIHVVGKVEEEFSGENAFGGVISAPLITASKVEEADYGTAFEPAITTMSVNKEINQNGYIIKVHNINFAKNNTRVHLTIVNNSNNEVYFSTYSARAVQGDKQFNVDVGNENYRELDKTILPGVKEDGVVVFKPLDPDGGDAKFIFEGYDTKDYSLEFEPYTFEVNMQ